MARGGSLFCQKLCMQIWGWEAVLLPPQARDVEPEKQPWNGVCGVHDSILCRSVLCMCSKKRAGLRWISYIYSRPTCSHEQILPWLHKQVWCSLGPYLETGFRPMALWREGTTASMKVLAIALTPPWVTSLYPASLSISTFGLAATPIRQSAPSTQGAQCPQRATPSGWLFPEAAEQPIDSWIPAKALSLAILAGQS